MTRRYIANRRLFNRRLIGVRYLAAAACAGLVLLVAAPVVTPAAAREVVTFHDPQASPGTIVIKTSQRRLYLVIDSGHALRYPVGVGRAGMQWSGRTYIDGKYVKPAWSPPASIKRENPRIPDVIPGGSPRNPMGAAAMTLNGGEYAIHGTNAPGSVGGFVSHGCIRMYNQDIVDLYERVSTGTPVIVTR